MVHPDPVRAEIHRSSAANRKAGRFKARILTMLSFSTLPIMDPAYAGKSSRDGRYFCSSRTCVLHPLARAPA